MKVKINGGLWIAIVLGFVAAKPPVSDDRVTNHRGLSRNRRDVTILDRLGCQPGDPQPLNRVNTTERLKKLRNLFYSARHNRELFDIKAYIIPTDDAHASEYVADHDKRRDFISGFTGSAGTAVVTLTEAALWTDGRYFLQADQQMDCNWLLMKQGQPGVPSIIEWLKTILSVGDLVGADPKLLNAETWLNYRAELDEVGIQLRSINTNLVDRVWGTEQPPYPSAPAFVHEIDFAGRSWQDKLGDIREQLVKNDADAIVVTALDEVAWTLNLRGADIPYNPLFRSFLVIDSTRAFLFTPTEKVTGSVLDHLNTRNCGSAVCVDVMEYETINSVLTGMAVAWEYVIIPRRYSYSGGASFSIYELIPETKVVLMPSPVIFLKAKKNPTEVEGMRRAHIKDAVALCDFLAKLEKEVQSSVTWDELKVVEVLDEFRSQQNESMGASFYTIAGFGANGAVIHYEPAPETNMNIDMNGLLLIDSGGQYLDGTTDVTRTLHYGKPTEWHKETYTRVLMGHIDLGLLTFPEGTTDKDVDIIARAPLYSAGLDYRHGTGHGIGAFLSVHEALDLGKGYVESTYMSIEPGYYEDGNFGIRLENIVRVVKKNTTYQFGGINYYGFEPITLVPFEPSLILTELLSVRQKQWLNEYNSRIRLEVGDALKKQGRMDGFHWMMSKTNFITEDCKSSATTMLPLIPAIFSFLYFL